MDLNKSLSDIYKNFKVRESFSNAVPYGSGHIHDTYKISTGDPSQGYILQKLNHIVFRDIPAVQDNISRVTKHLRKKLEEQGEKDIDRKCLRLIETRENKTWLLDKGGNYWRLYKYISDHKNYDIVENNQIAYEGARAIGRFQALLDDLPGPRLNETIPDFHNIDSRYNQFKSVLSLDPMSRAGECRDEIKFVNTRIEGMRTILELGKKGIIPERITHNDTKFNNILFDHNDKALCIIDLDTVMPGFVHYDFGDAIRTAASSAAEDEDDLSGVYMKIDIYEVFARAYLDETKKVLNDAEIHLLPSAPSLISFIMGLRFLTDYINGDKYYKIRREKHNLIRARNQFKLVESNEEQFEQMKSIIADIINNQ